jgi:transposase
MVELLYGRCAGLDVHKKSVSACIRITDGNRTRKETATFRTFTADLERLGKWLEEHQVTHVALESTGVFWIPVWNILERSAAGFKLTLINPQHVHALPGHKTDRKDCEYIAELLQHGLLKGSFIPPRPIRELRDVTRRRTHLQSDRNRVLNRIRRLLETANFKLGSVVSDINGRTAHSILDELARGNCDPKKLAQLAKASLKNKKAELAASLHGFYSEHFRWLLSEAVQELADLDRKLEQVDKRLAKQLQPHADLILRLCTIPGVDFTTAAVILAEIGMDMSRFPDAGHLASWAGLSPGNNESAGKRYSGSTCKGNRYLRRILTQSAWSLLRKKDCYLTALFRRVSVKGGRKKAALAVAHRMLIIAWHIIQDGTVYEELGGNHYDRLHPDRSARRLIKRLEQIGFQVTVNQAAPKSAPMLNDTNSTLKGAVCKKLSAIKNKSATADPSVPRAVPKPADPNLCPRCARWGIPCIHARNSLMLPTAVIPSNKISTT